MIPDWATTIIRHRRHRRLAWAERYADGARAVDIQGGMEFPLRTDSWEVVPHLNHPKFAASVGDLVMVSWVDSSSCDAWQSPEVAKSHSVAKCQTAGWVAAIHPDRVVIASTREEGGGICQTRGIPVQAILDIEVLSEERALTQEPRRGC